MLNNAAAPFDNKNARLALAHALDRQLLIDVRGVGAFRFLDDRATALVRLVEDVGRLRARLVVDVRRLRLRALEVADALFGRREPVGDAHERRVRVGAEVDVGEQPRPQDETCGGQLGNGASVGRMSRRRRPSRAAR